MFTKECLKCLKYIELFSDYDLDSYSFLVPAGLVIDMNINDNGEGYILFDKEAFSICCKNSVLQPMDERILGKNYKFIHQICFKYFGGDDYVNVECNPLEMLSALDSIVEYSSCPYIEEYEDSFKLLFGSNKRVDNNYFDLVYGLNKVLSKRKFKDSILEGEIVEFHTAREYDNFSLIMTFRVKHPMYKNKEIDLLFYGVNGKSFEMDFCESIKGDFVCYMSKSAFDENKIYVMFDGYDSNIYFECAEIYAFNCPITSLMDDFDVEDIKMCTLDERKMFHLGLHSDDLDINIDGNASMFNNVIELYGKDSISNRYLYSWLSIVEGMILDIEDFGLSDQCYDIIVGFRNGEVDKDKVISFLDRCSKVFWCDKDLKRKIVFVGENCEEYIINLDDAVLFEINGKDYRELMDTNEEVETYELRLNNPIMLPWFSVNAYSKIIPHYYHYCDFFSMQIIDGEKVYEGGSLWLGRNEYYSYSQVCYKDGDEWVYKCDKKRKPTFFKGVFIEQQVKDFLKMSYDETLNAQLVGMVDELYIDDFCYFTSADFEDLKKLNNVKKVNIDYLDKKYIDFFVETFPLVEDIRILNYEDMDEKVIEVLKNLKEVKNVSDSFCEDCFDGDDDRRCYEGELSDLNIYLRNNFITFEEYSSYKKKLDFIRYNHRLTLDDN